MITAEELIAMDVKTVNVRGVTNARINWEHLAKVMDARKEKDLSYSLIFSIVEPDFNAKVLADPITIIPTFAVTY